MRRRATKFVMASASAALLAGCASSSDLRVLENPKNGFQDVSSHVVTATGKSPVWIQSLDQAQWAANRSRELLSAGVLSADDAVRVALLNNKGLQADFAQIGISSAEMWQETMLVNPIVSIGTAEKTAVRIFESAIVGNLLALITRERRVAVADAKFREAQHVAAEKVLQLAFDTERAWVRAVAARETVAYLQKAQTAADATSDLAKELGRTGAFNKSAQAREHAVYAEITGQLAEVKMNERTAREALNRLLGAWGKDIDYNLPKALPRLPSSVAMKSNIEREALRKRIDLRIAMLELDSVARSHKLTDATRYVTDLELLAGVEFEDPKGGGDAELSKKRIELEFSIPIFDSGKAKLRRAEFVYMQAANRLAEKAVNIRSEARSAYDRYRSTYEIARHYRDRVVPLREVISEEALLAYNGMISSTFELLADTRSSMSAMLTSVNAKQNFWLAEVDLRSAIHGGYGGSSDGVGVSLAGGGGGVH